MHGFLPADVPLVMQVGDRIMSGMARPGGSGKEYLGMLPMRLWSTAPAALTTWFRENVATGAKLSPLLDFEAPFKEAVLTDKYKTAMAAAATRAAKK